MALSRRLLTVGAMGVAAFALIGAGATATFNDAAQSRQQITAGSMHMTISGPADSWTNGKILTLKTTGPVGSTFTTGPQLVTVTNEGDITSELVKLTVSAPTNNTALANGIRVTIQLPDTRVPVYDGPLTGLATAASSGINGQRIADGKSMSAYVTFYANNLPNDAQGGVVTPTFTVDFTG
jgi:predicted ribosomally synthesized peptide with SipW-like signal peptide